MPINLTRQDIDRAMPKIQDGLNKYLWLQYEAKNGPNFHLDPDFQRHFNHFYRVRRGAQWRAAFYDLMGRAKTLTFDAIVEELQKATGRLEGSFASKLYATLKPSAPVIDSEVLKNLHWRMPHAKHPDRHGAVCTLHAKLGQELDVFLQTTDGDYLIRKFNMTYAKEKATVTAQKKLDLVLWQNR